MTHHKITVLEDGTRVYSNGTRYKPKAPEERVYARRQPPPEAGAVRWGGTWLLPLDLVPLEDRLWPPTRPDTDAYAHAFKPRRCKCEVCKRPEAKRWRRAGLKVQRQMRIASAGD